MKGFPTPDLPTHDRLYGIAIARPEDVGQVSSEILSAVFSFLIGTVGSVKTAEIMRTWAAAARRYDLKAVKE